MKLEELAVLGLVIISSFADGYTFKDDVTLNLEQKKALDKFKLVMADKLPHSYMKEDIYLIKWLRARNFDLIAAEKFLSENLEWRRENNMDGIHDEDWSDFQRDYQVWFEGRDKQGRPIAYFEVGTHDVRKSVVTGRVDRYLRYTSKTADDLCTLVRVLGDKYENVTRAQLIVDMQGYNLVQHGCIQCIGILLQMFKLYEQHHPGCVDQIILVRTPALIEPLLNAARPILSEETRRSLKIYGTNKKQWIEEMSKDFDFDQLPPAIGGTKVYKGMEPEDSGF